MGGSAAAKPQAWGGHILAVALVGPALAVVALFFILPLALSAVGAFRAAGGGFTLAHFAKSLDLYGRDL
ncbi:MAG TPA: sugar ABC transporter permease, partial [Casimicrobiaceae bacterium]|nr:sugar ABC transporter permease [Casimicrobiaceae bacterium]